MEKENKLMLDIQFFASEEKDEDGNEIENEEVEDNVEDEQEDLDTEEESFDDDVEDEEEKKAEQPKKKQGRVENSKYAEMRREQEKAKQEREALKLEGMREGIKKAYNGLNKFTEKPLTDEHSIDLFMMQLEMEAKGLDPINDLPDYIADKNRSKAIERANNDKKQDWYAKDGEEFAKAYPNVSINDLNEDKKFVIFAKGKIGNVPLKEIYEDYLELVGDFNKDADIKSRKAVAKKLSSPQSTKQSEESNLTEYSVEKIKNMSLKQIRDLERNNPKEYARFMKAYDKFIKNN